MSSLFNAERLARCLHALEVGGGGSELFEALAGAYGDAARAYHGVHHIEACLAALDAARALAERPAEIEVALWFHDAIYDARRHDNEARSAAWALEVLEAGGAPAAVRARVESLILATRHAAVPVAADEQLLIDIDLGILGQPPAVFARYEAQIRAEYAWVEPAAYRARRAALLEGFLAREHIYCTAHFRALLEAQARENLAASIARLRAGSGRGL